MSVPTCFLVVPRESKIVRKTYSVGKLFSAAQVKFVTATLTVNPMANTFSQIYLQFVFAVLDRHCLIKKENKEEVHKYMTGLVSNREAKMLAVHCMPDHTHLFVGFRPVRSISDFVKEIAVESNEFINGKRWIKGKFAWQEGYGVFFYSHSHINSVVNYIKNQETHQRKTSFREEYIAFLQKFQIPFNEKYFFKFIE
jgi:putative transposase